MTFLFQNNQNSSIGVHGEEISGKAGFSGRVHVRGDNFPFVLSLNESTKWNVAASYFPAHLPEIHRGFSFHYRILQCLARAANRLAHSDELFDAVAAGGGSENNRFCSSQHCKKDCGISPKKDREHDLNLSARISLVSSLSSPHSRFPIPFYSVKLTFQMILLILYYKKRKSSIDKK